MSIFKRVVSTLRPDRSTQPAEQNQQPPGEPTSSDRGQTNSDIVSPPDTEAISGQTTPQVASAAADEVTRTNEKIEGVEEAIRAAKEAIKDTNEAIKEQKQRLEDLEDSRPTKGGYENAADFRKAQAAHQVAVSEAQEAVRDLEEELHDLNKRVTELNEEARELNDVLDKLEDQIEELNEQTDDGEPADSHDVERADNTADDTGAALGRDDEPDPRDRLTREDVFGEADAIEGEVEPPADDQQALMGTLSGIHKEIRDTQESIVRNMLSEEPDSVENYDLSGLEPPDVAVAPHPPDASVVPGDIDLEESLQQASEATPFAAEVLQSVTDEGMIDNLHSVDTEAEEAAASQAEVDAAAATAEQALEAPAVATEEAAQAPADTADHEAAAARATAEISATTMSETTRAEVPDPLSSQATTAPASFDSDNDGLLDREELNVYGTDPHKADTDGDGLSDGDEVDFYGTHPNVADSDGDGLSDGEEVNLHGTDPRTRDTDGDSLIDGGEVNFLGTDPLDADMDNDGMDDGKELNWGTDPSNWDTDGDGLSDFDEVDVHHTDPFDPDTDDDSLSDGDEIFGLGTNPRDPDTDGDGLTDGEEVDVHRTDPLSADADADGLSDVDEIAHGTDPHHSDTDKDGLSDGDEIAYGTDPHDADTDDDWLSDGDEVNIHGTDPLRSDEDADGLPDPYEVYLGTDPARADTDGDGLSDGAEIFKYETDPMNPDTDFDGLSDGDEIVFGADPMRPDTDGDGLWDGAEVSEYGTNPKNPDTDFDGLSDGHEVNIYGTDPLNVAVDSGVLSYGEGEPPADVIDTVEGEIDRAGPFPSPAGDSSAVGAGQDATARAIPGSADGLDEIEDTVERRDGLQPADMRTEEGTGRTFADTVAELSARDTPVDINVFVQAVLRDSYTEANEDLAHAVDKVEFFNELKHAMREYPEALRDAVEVAAAEYEAGALDEDPSDPHLVSQIGVLPDDNAGRGGGLSREDITQEPDEVGGDASFPADPVDDQADVMSSISTVLHDTAASVIRKMAAGNSVDMPDVIDSSSLAPPHVDDEPPPVDFASDELLELQNAMQAQSRVSTMATNVMKAKADAGSSTISTIRGDDPPADTDAVEPPISDDDDGLTRDEVTVEPDAIAGDAGHPLDQEDLADAQEAQEAQEALMDVMSGQLQEMNDTAESTVRNMKEAPPADADGDQLSDADEFSVYGSDPRIPDADGDGLSDGDEVNVHGAEPWDPDPDPDGDGLSDGDEVKVHGTDSATIDLPPPTTFEEAIAGVDAEALTIEQDFDPSLIVAEPLEDIGRGPFDQPGIGSGDIPEIGLEDGDGETALDDTDGADLGDWRDDNSDSG